MTSAPQPEQALNHIRAAIIAARENLDREASFDLAPLTGVLEGLCEQIAALPTEVAQGYAASLQSTLQLLEALENDIHGAHDKLQQRMEDLGVTETASGEGAE
ncbi:MAG: hypothetical protein ISR50_17735 [Alphaproteobacteria bacterium]|nr:hypothetical protein [Alphaproteobacteria bacterium]